MKRIFILFSITAFVMMPISAHADEETLKKILSEVQSLKQRVSDLENVVGSQANVIKSQANEISEYRKKFAGVDNIKEESEGVLAEYGLKIAAGATSIVQVTSGANADGLSGQGKDDVTDGSYSVDIEIEKEFGEGIAFLHLETGNGAGVTDELKVFSNVNRDQDNSGNAVSVTEMFYETHLFGQDMTSFTFGKIDPTVYIDTNEYANDETTQFLGEIFRNNPTIEFPDNGAGVRLGIEPIEDLEIQVIASDGDGSASPEDLFNTIFGAGQINLKKGLFGGEGNIRAYGWINDTAHTKWLHQLDDQETGYGFGLSIDQELTELVGIFLRYGWQNPEVTMDTTSFSLEHAWSAGMQIAGEPWGRENDIFAIAYGQAIPSDEYKTANSLVADPESHLEAYYSFYINDHLTLSPDLQVIWNPYGGDAALGDDTIVVGGARAQIDF
ncbi:MAG: carbohydrate porin [Candidatus Omnitrophica bacterium]|nr:carbohydrate porin [Candidatus Omnitrophota bacterium]MCB9747510.1 carbohydrate porin [Candidatus Omnitrophota bacterium]